MFAPCMTRTRLKLTLFEHLQASRQQVRISEQIGHWFRFNSDSDSEIISDTGFGPFRTAISVSIRTVLRRVRIRCPK